MLVRFYSVLFRICFSRVGKSTTQFYLSLFVSFPFCMFVFVFVHGFARVAVPRKQRCRSIDRSLTSRFPGRAAIRRRSHDAHSVRRSARRRGCSHLPRFSWRVEIWRCAREERSSRMRFRSPGLSRRSRFFWRDETWRFSREASAGRMRFRSVGRPWRSRFFGRAEIWRRAREARPRGCVAGIPACLRFPDLSALQRYNADTPQRQRRDEVAELSADLPYPDFSGAQRYGDSGAK